MDWFVGPVTFRVRSSVTGRLKEEAFGGIGVIFLEVGLVAKDY